MEGQTNLNNLNKLSGYFLIILFSVGVIGHIFILDLMKTLTPLTLFIVNSLFLFVFLKNQNQLEKKKAILILPTIFIITLVIEIIGEKTGSIFGKYAYGNVLSYDIIEIYNVPLIIGFNWVMVILSATALSSRITYNEYLQIPVAGLIAVAFDYVLEPVAIRLGYWYWLDEFGFSIKEIPLENYIAWFLISSIFAFIIKKSNLNTKGNYLIYYFFCQLFFFQILNIFMRVLR